MKYYIGFYNKNNMIFSCVTRKNSVIFYSKAKLNDIEVNDLKLHFRDVNKIGHYTNHLPTEIIVESFETLQEFFKYLEKLLVKYE